MENKNPLAPSDNPPIPSDRKVRADIFFISLRPNGEIIHASESLASIEGRDPEHHYQHVNEIPALFDNIRDLLSDISDLADKHSEIIIQLNRIDCKCKIYHHSDVICVEGEMLHNISHTQSTQIPYHDIFHSSMEAMIITDHQGQCMDINEAAFAMLGLDRHEIPSLHIQQIFSSLHDEAIQAISGGAVEKAYIEEMPVQVKTDLKYLRLKITSYQENLALMVVTDITKKKKNEEKLKLVQQQLQLAVEGGEIGTWIYYIDEGRNLIIDQWSRMLGYEVDEIDRSYEGWLSLIHHEDRRNVTQKAAKVISGEDDNWEYSFRLKHKRGEYRWILSRGKVLKRDDHGKAKVLAGTHTDITDQKITLDLLVKSQHNYHEVVEKLPLMFYRLDKSGQLTYMNNSGKKYFGIDLNTRPAEIDMGDLIHPDDLPQTKRDYIKAVENNIPYHTMHRMRKFDGSFEWWESNAFRSEEGGWIGFDVNIHDKMLTQQRLEKIEQNFELITQNIDEIIWLRDKEYYHILSGKNGKNSVSRLFSDSFNGTIPDKIPVEVADALLYRYSAPEEKEYLKVAFRHFTETREPMDIQYSLRVNKQRYWLWNRNFYLSETEDLQLGVIKDITALKHSEEQLKSANEELDNFVYRVSHDLRAPLTSSLGLLQIIRQTKDIDEIFTYLDLQQRSLRKLDKFIHDILDYSRNNRKSFELKEINIDELIESILKDLAYLDGFNEVKINRSIETPLPFYSDELRLKIILNNLLCNAIKYKKYNYREARVDIQFETDTRHAILIVEDNGMGIESHHHGRIFEMFYRATDINAGSGIGLYITADAVKKLGGQINFTSEHGKGTKYEIIIPNKLPAARGEFTSRSGL